LKAAVVEALAQIRLKEVEAPKLLPDSLMLRVKACAVCGSDLRIVYAGDRRARFPLILGHEMAAEVVKVGADAHGFAVGDRVTVAPGVSCGECYCCRKGWQNLCLNMISIGYFWPGSFAEYMVPPPRALTQGFVNKIPDGLPFVEATLAEPLACCLNGQELLHVTSDDTVVVIGAGPTGLMHAMLAVNRGCRKVIVVQRSAGRLNLARERVKADLFVSGLQEDAVERVEEATDGLGADVVIVAAPSKEAQRMALEMVGRRGRVSFFGGLPHGDPMAFLDSNLIHYKECSVMGASSSTSRQNHEALGLLATGAIRASDLITHVFPLEQIQAALEVARGRAGLKVVVMPSEDGALPDTPALWPQG
jgi:L-iditol 2-dehydrogenase